MCIVQEMYCCWQNTNQAREWWPKGQRANDVCTHTHFIYTGTFVHVPKMHSQERNKSTQKIRHLVCSFNRMWFWIKIPNQKSLIRVWDFILYMHLVPTTKQWWPIHIPQLPEHAPLSSHGDHSKIQNWPCPSSPHILPGRFCKLVRRASACLSSPS